MEIAYILDYSLYFGPILIVVTCRVIFVYAVVIVERATLRHPAVSAGGHIVRGVACNDIYGVAASFDAKGIRASRGVCRGAADGVDFIDGGCLHQGGEHDRHHRYGCDKCRYGQTYIQSLLFHVVGDWWLYVYDDKSTQ